MAVVQEPMAKKSKPATQVTVRIDNDWLERLDALSTALSRPGLELTRVDAIRMAIARGLQEMEREQRRIVQVSPTERVFAALCELQSSRYGRPVTSEALEERLLVVGQAGVKLSMEEISDSIEKLCGDDRIKRVKVGSSVGYLRL